MRLLAAQCAMVSVAMVGLAACSSDLDAVSLGGDQARDDVSSAMGATAESDSALVAVRTAGRASQDIDSLEFEIVANVGGIRVLTMGGTFDNESDGAKASGQIFTEINALDGSSGSVVTTLVDGVLYIERYTHSGAKQAHTRERITEAKFDRLRQGTVFGIFSILEHAEDAAYLDKSTIDEITLDNYSFTADRRWADEILRQQLGLSEVHPATLSGTVSSDKDSFPGWVSIYTDYASLTGLDSQEAEAMAVEMGSTRLQIVVTVRPRSGKLNVVAPDPEIFEANTDSSGG